MRAFASLTIVEAAFSDERFDADDERVADFFIMSLAAFRKQNVFCVTRWRMQANPLPLHLCPPALPPSPLPSLSLFICCDFDSYTLSLRANVLKAGRQRE